MDGMRKKMRIEPIIQGKKRGYERCHDDTIECLCCLRILVAYQLSISFLLSKDVCSFSLFLLVSLDMHKDKLVFCVRAIRIEYKTEFI